jgi:hypothetical protein
MCHLCYVTKLALKKFWYLAGARFISPVKVFRVLRHLDFPAKIATG